MLNYLSSILTGLEDIPNLIIAGVDAVLNGLFAALAAFATILFNALHAVAPMPNLPSITAGSWMGWLNWFAPIGLMIDSALSLLAMYVGWLTIRWAFAVIKLGGEGV